MLISNCINIQWDTALKPATDFIAGLQAEMGTSDTEVFSQELAEYLASTANSRLVDSNTPAMARLLAAAMSQSKAAKRMINMVGQMIDTGGIKSIDDANNDTFLGKRLRQELIAHNQETRTLVIDTLVDEEMDRLRYGGKVARGSDSIWDFVPG